MRIPWNLGPGGNGDEVEFGMRMRWELGSRFHGNQNEGEIRMRMRWIQDEDPREIGMRTPLNLG